VGSLRIISDDVSDDVAGGPKTSCRFQGSRNPANLRGCPVLYGALVPCIAARAVPKTVLVDRDHLVIDQVAVVCSLKTLARSNSWGSRSQRYFNKFRYEWNARARLGAAGALVLCRSV
jgi:hypothetical protein